MKSLINILSRVGIKFILCCVFILNYIELISQTDLIFNNGVGDGIYTSGGTGAGTIGAIYHWSNVGTESGVTIDAEIEIKSIFGGAILTTIDGSSSPQDWEPQISGPNTTDGNSYGIEFEVRFKDQSTGLPYSLGSFLSQTIDVDGGGTGSALREFTTFNSPSSYVLENPTLISASIVSGGIMLKSGESLYPGISITATEYIASCTYSSTSSFKVTCGVIAEGGSCSGNRLFSLNFRDVVTFTEPVGVLPVELASFQAENIGSTKVLVQWETKSEKDMDFFTLERLDENKDVTVVSIVKATGESSSSIIYNCYDYNAPDDIVYYRLKQTDKYGKINFSDIISVNNRKSTNEIVRKINMMGNDVDNGETGIVILIYKNNKMVKTIQK